MPRPLVQDVVPPNRKSIRDVSIEHHHRKRIRLPIEEPQDNGGNIPPPQEPAKKVYPRRRKPKLFVWIASGTLILGCLFIVSMLFSGARVDVTINHAEVRIDDSAIAYKEAPSPDALVFQTAKISKNASRNVPATGRELVQKRASGNIIIYNTFSTQPQRLITNTRFESPDGKIYRIDRSVVVPGMAKDGDETTPGSIEVTVYADSPGEQYNVENVDFTIPGFKGDPRFAKFYARSVTPITGGFSGEVNVAEPDEVARVREELRAELLGVVEKEIQSQYPDDFILYTDAIFTAFESLPDRDSENKDSLTVTEKAVAHAFIFKKSDFSKYVARKTIGSYNGESIQLMNPSDLTFEVEDRASVLPETDVQLAFKISGPARLVWDFDPEALKMDLAGKPKSEAEEILKQHTEIKTTQITIRPFWKDVLPDRESRIRVKVVEDTN